MFPLAPLISTPDFSKNKKEMAQADAEKHQDHHWKSFGKKIKITYPPNDQESTRRKINAGREKRVVKTLPQSMGDSVKTGP